MKFKFGFADIDEGVSRILSEKEAYKQVKSIIGKMGAKSVLRAVVVEPEKVVRVCDNIWVWLIEDCSEALCMCIASESEDEIEDDIED
jgi:hypothetical protein